MLRKTDLLDNWSNKHCFLARLLLVLSGFLEHFIAEC